MCAGFPQLQRKRKYVTRIVECGTLEYSSSPFGDEHFESVLSANVQCLPGVHDTNSEIMHRVRCNNVCHDEKHMFFMYFAREIVDFSNPGEPSLGRPALLVMFRV